MYTIISKQMPVSRLHSCIDIFTISAIHFFLLWQSFCTQKIIDVPKGFSIAENANTSMENGNCYNAPVQTQNLLYGKEFIKQTMIKHEAILMDQSVCYMCHQSAYEVYRPRGKLQLEESNSIIATLCSPLLKLVSFPSI